MTKNFEVDRKITSLVSEYYLIIDKSCQANLDFTDLNQSTKREF